MSDFRVLPNTHDGDSGGVHLNSGIHNRAAFLVMTSVDAAGKPLFTPAQAAGVFYLALTQQLSATSQFADSRRAVVSSVRVGWGTGVRTLGSGGNSTHFKVGLSPAPMATFPAAPPKIPYGGFSPVRLQVPGTAQFSRESSRVGRWLKCDPHIRRLPTQLALAFGIASAGRDPTSMCGASASDDSTWTQRSSLR